MHDRHRESAERVRSELERGEHDPASFRAAFTNVPPSARDAWLNLVLGLDELPADEPDLPRNCVPYLPCPVDAVLRVVDQVPVRASDFFVDIGSGLGRVGALVHLLTGAPVIGIEIQSQLVRASRELAQRLRAPRLGFIEGDAVVVAGSIAIDSVVFLYCPFSGDRLASVLAEIEPLARVVCCVDLPLPPCDWLVVDEPRAPDLAIYRRVGLPSAYG